METKLLTATALALTVTVLATTEASAAKMFDAYAPAGADGPWYYLPVHVGPVTYTVSYEVLDKTTVTGEVKFTDANGEEVTLPFDGTITFRTSKFPTVPQVRFRGMPCGSLVRVKVSP
jgi:hypothetical protein